MLSSNFKNDDAKEKEYTFLHILAPILPPRHIPHSIRRLDMLGLRTRSAVQHEPLADGDERYPKRAKGNAQPLAQAKAPSAQKTKKLPASKLYAIAKI